MNKPTVILSACIAVLSPVALLRAETGTIIIGTAADTRVFNAPWGVDQNEGVGENMGIYQSRDRSLLRFDFGVLPTGFSVNNSVLSLTATDLYGGNPNGESMDIFRLTRSWTETGVTWNRYDGTSAWTNAGGDYDATVYASSTANPGTGQQVNWNITALTQGWANNTFANNGLIIINSGTTSGLHFATRENGNAAYRPTLTATITTANAPAVGAWVWNGGAGGTGPVDGGGTWTDANAWWNGAAATWVDGNDAVFGAGNGTAGTVTVSGTVAPKSIWFQATGGGTYTIDGGTIDLAGGVRVIHTTVDGAINSTITNGTIFKQGSATLTLNGANTHSGGTTIAGGTLKAGNPQALGAFGNFISVSAGASLDINGQALQGYTQNIRIAGAGASPEMGAIGNTGAANLNGIRGITLTANASIGGNGGRYDIGRVDFNADPNNTVNHIDGGGFVLTKTGSNDIGLLTGATNLAGFIVAAGRVLPHENTAFGTAPVTVESGATVRPWGGLTLANAFTLNSGTLAQEENFTDNYNGPVTVNGAATVQVGPGTIIINGVISGAGSMNKTGGGFWKLAGDNVQTGTLTVSGGHVRFGSTTGNATRGNVEMLNPGSFLLMEQPNQFGPNSGLLFNSSGHSEFALYGNNQTIASLASTNQFAVVQNSHAGFGAATANSVLTINQQTDTTYSGIIRNNTGNDAFTLALVKTGNGKLTLDTNTEFTGGTTVNGGVLEIANSGGGNGRLRGTVTVNTGGELRYTGGDGTGFGYNNNNKIDTLNIIGGLVTSPDRTTHVWNSTVNMTGGELRVNNGVSDPNGNQFEWGNSSVNTFASADTATISGRIRIRNDSTPTLVFTVADGAAPVDLLVSAAVTRAGGASNVTKEGPGTIAFTGEFAHGGTTAINGGVLILNRAANTDYGAGTTFTGAGTLRKLGAGEIVWGGNATTFAMGSGSVIEIQEGSFVGGSNANENWTANLSDLSVAVGATFRGVEANVRVDALTGAGTISSGYPGAGYGQFTFGVDNGSGTFNGVLVDGDAPANFVKEGTGTQTLAGANRYSGVTVLAGGVLNVATLSDYGVDGGLGNRAGDGGGDNVGILFRGGTLRYAGSTPQSTNRAIRVSTAGGAVIDASGSSPSATLTFSRTASSPNFWENAGTRTLTLTGSNTGDNTFAHPIDDLPGVTTTNLVKSGAGRWILAGVNSYSGATAVNEGTLIVTGSISGTAVTVNAGTFGGTGIAGAVTANSGATISPGLSAGIFNTGPLTMSAGSTLSIEISGLFAGSDYDQMIVDGEVNISGATLLVSGSYLTAPAITNDEFSILVNDGDADPVIGTFAGLAEGATVFSGLGQAYTITYEGGDGNDIVLTAVPEPGSAALILGGFGVAGFCRRRRRS